MNNIPKEVFHKFNNVDEYIEELCQPDDEGRVMYEIGSDPKVFKERYTKFKESLEEDFPTLTKKEIVNFYNNFYKLSEIFNKDDNKALMDSLNFELNKYTGTFRVKDGGKKSSVSRVGLSKVDELVNKVKETPKEFTVNFTDIKKEDVYFNVEKRNGQVFVYIFHEKYFRLSTYEGTYTFYVVNDDSFHSKFDYIIDYENDYSLNEYISDFNTEEECVEFLHELGYMTSHDLPKIDEIVSKLKKSEKTFKLQYKKVRKEDIRFAIDESDDGILVYTFYNKYLENGGYDDTCVFYMIDDDYFHKHFEYLIYDKSSYVINEYSCKLKTKEECIKFLHDNGYKTTSDK